MTRQHIHITDGTALPHLPNPDGSNRMEMAILEFGQLQSDLAAAHNRIEALDAECRDRDTTIMRLSGLVDMLREQLSSATTQRNAFMKHAVELAVQVDAIAEAADAQTQMVRSMAARAKATAALNAGLTPSGEVATPPQATAAEVHQQDDDDGAAAMARRFAPPEFTGEAVPGVSRASRLLRHLS